MLSYTLSVFWTLRMSLMPFTSNTFTPFTYFCTIFIQRLWGTRVIHFLLNCVHNVQWMIVDLSRTNVFSWKTLYEHSPNHQTKPNPKFNRKSLLIYYILSSQQETERTWLIDYELRMTAEILKTSWPHMQIKHKYKCAQHSTAQHSTAAH